MTLRVGIIGVGHLTSYVVEGLCAANDPPDILLSPRNAERASALSERFGVRTAANDNRTVVSQSDIVILATRPPQALNAATDLPWRAEQTLICVAAGVSCAGLSTVASPARIVRAMPISCAAIGESPTSLYPDDANARSLLTRLGPVIALPDESSFQAASVIGAYYAWIYALVAETMPWLETAGVPNAAGRSLLLQAIRGATGMMLARPDDSPADMIRKLATPGGITERGLELLDQRGALTAWRDACQVSLERLQNQ
jgi:pyrroline-5-carboxylate reductase